MLMLILLLCEVLVNVAFSDEKMFKSVTKDYYEQHVSAAERIECYI